jgi:transposase-like protein
VSKSQVSALTAKLDAEVNQWRTRPLTEAYPYLIFDARYEKVRRGSSVVSQGVLVAIGISAAGYREVLGCWVAESESEASWGAVFAELKAARSARCELCGERRSCRAWCEPSSGIFRARCGSAARCILCATR